MKKYLYILTISLLALPMSANTLTGSVDIQCAKTELKVDESTTCTIKGNTTDEVSAVSMKLGVGSNLTLTSVTTDSIWQGDGEGGNIELYTDSNKSGNFNIATFTIKADSVSSSVTTNVSLSNVNLSDKNFEETSIKVNPLSVSISEATSDSQKPDSGNTETDKPSDGESEVTKPEDNEDSDKVEKPDDSKDETNKEETDDKKDSVTDKEEVVENPPTGLYISFGIIGMFVISIVTFVIIKKKKYFSEF